MKQDLPGKKLDEFGGNYRANSVEGRVSPNSKAMPMKRGKAPVDGLESALGFKKKGSK